MDFCSEEGGQDGDAAHNPEKPAMPGKDVVQKFPAAAADMAGVPLYHHIIAGQNRQTSSWPWQRPEVRPADGKRRS